LNHERIKLLNATKDGKFSARSHKTPANNVEAEDKNEWKLPRPKAIKFIS
jgi:hypothetical protein